MMSLRRLITPLIGLALATTASAQTVDKKSLSLDGAKAVLAACEAQAAQLGAGGAIAVVDDGGNLIAMHRIDGTFAAAANVSIGKARTAAIFRKPTAAFEQTIRDGRTPMLALNDFTPLQGGVPIVIDGQVVGAVGMSGAASAEQDEQIAKAGAAVVAAKTPARLGDSNTSPVATAAAVGGDSDAGATSIAADVSRPETRSADDASKSWLAMLAFVPIVGAMFVANQTESRR